MGTIFSFRDIVSGHTPSDTGVSEVVRYHRSHLLDIPGIIGGIIAGSALTAPTVRSDVDCLILFDAKFRDEVKAGIRSLRAFSKSRFVPIQETMLDTTISRTRFHSIEWGFHACLVRAADQGGVIGTNPLRYIHSSHLCPQREAEDYFRYKQRTFDRKAIGFGSAREQLNLKGLQKALENPPHVARKALNYIGVTYDDTRAGIAAACRAHLPDKLADRLDALLSLDDWYSEQLQCQMEHPDSREYRRVLKELSKAHEMGYKFMRGTILCLSNR